MEEYKLMLTAQEIIDVNDRLRKAETLNDKLSIILNAPGSMHYALCEKHEIKLEGEILDDDENLKAIGDFAFNSYVPFLLDQKKKDLLTRLQDVDFDLKIERLKGELALIQADLAKNENDLKKEGIWPGHYFMNGYRDRQTGKRPTRYVDFRYVTESEKYIDGAVAFDYELFVNRELKSAMITENDIGDERTVSLEIKNIPNRLALFQHLGIIDFLLEKYDQPLSNRPANMTALLSTLMGITDKEKGSFASTVKHLLNNDETRSPDNAKARKLNSTELSKIGIELFKKTQLNKK